MANGFGLYGKLAPPGGATGALTDIYYRAPQSWPDGSTDVPLAAQPDPAAIPPPWTYNAQTQLAVSARRIRRPLYAIYNDLKALTATQQTEIWTDISSGSPVKYLLDQGPNAAALVVIDWAARASGVTGTALAEAEFRAVALYVQDNPTYLVHPTFDTSILVPGDQPG